MTNNIVVSKMTLEDKIWKNIEKEYEISKKSFGLKIAFVKDPYKRTAIFRDIAHAYDLSKKGYYKPAVILAGSVIEELLRLYLLYKDVTPNNYTFSEYVKQCENNGFLKIGISKLGDSVRHFRNLVHLAAEKEKRYAISKPTAIGSVTSIFTLANDFN